MYLPDRLVISDADMERAAWHRLVLTHPARPDAGMPVVMYDTFDIYTDPDKLREAKAALVRELGCTITELAIPADQVPQITFHG